MIVYFTNNSDNRSESYSTTNSIETLESWQSVREALGICVKSSSIAELL